MFQRQSRLYGNLVMATDVAGILPALLVAYWVRDDVNGLIPTAVAIFQPELLPLGDYLLCLAVVLPVWIVVLAASQSYDGIVNRLLRSQFRRVASSLVLLGSLLALAVFATQLPISRAVFFGFFLLMSIGMVLTRVALHWTLRSRNLYPHTQVRILIVGTDERARRVAQKLERSRKWGYHVVGFVAVERDEIPGDDVLTTLDELPRLMLESLPAHEIIIAASRSRDLERYQELIDLCEELGVRTRLAVDFLSASQSNLSLEFLGEMPFITFSKVPDHSVGFVAKRVMDFALAALAIVVLLPVMLLVAIAIRLSSRGPSIYRQERCGLYGRQFKLLKFRTMSEGAEDRLWEIRHLNEMDGPVFKMRDDPRVTLLGRYLRRYSIDELPQLWNVMKGEMSLVGPRAPLPEEVQAYSVTQRRRLSVKPGITCLWQVAGRSDIDFTKWMEMDLNYIDNWSFWLDLRIMAKTIPAVFTGRGAR